MKEAEWSNIKPMLPLLAYAPFGVALDIAKATLLGRPVNTDWGTLMPMGARRLASVNVARIGRDERRRRPGHGGGLPGQVDARPHR